MHGAAAICSVMLALVDWPAEAAAAQELIARAAAEAAEAAADATEDGPPDLEAAPSVHAPPSRDGAHVQAHDPCPCCGSLVPATLIDMPASSALLAACHKSNTAGPKHILFDLKWTSLAPIRPRAT